MILRRFMKHVTDQNWFAVGLDVLVVITGIFLGMQVTDWNEDRKREDRSDWVMQGILGNLQYDKEKLEHRWNNWSGTLENARKTEAWLTDGSPDREVSWRVLLDMYNASQVSPFQRNKIAYQELQSSGDLDLIANAELRTLFSEYYSDNQAAERETTAYSHLPPYRQRIRAHIPASLTAYIWEHCFSYNKADDQALPDCVAPDDLTILPAVLEEVAADRQLLGDLRHWIAILSMSLVILEADQLELNQLIERTEASL